MSEAHEFVENLCCTYISVQSQAVFYLSFISVVAYLLDYDVNTLDKDTWSYLNFVHVHITLSKM